MPINVNHGEIWVIRFQTTSDNHLASACFCQVCPAVKPSHTKLPFLNHSQFSLSTPKLPNCMKHYEDLWSASLIFWQFIVHCVIHFWYVSICFNSLWVFDDLLHVFLCNVRCSLLRCWHCAANFSAPLKQPAVKTLRLLSVEMHEIRNQNQGWRCTICLLKQKRHEMLWCTAFLFAASLFLSNMPLGSSGISIAMNFIHIWGNLGSETFRNRYPEASRSNGSLLPRNTRDKPRCYKCTTTKGIAGPTICLGHALWYTSGETDSAVVLRSHSLRGSNLWQALLQLCISKV